MSRRGVILLILAILSAVVLQGAVLPIFIVGNFKPDMLLVIMVFLALRSSYETGAPLAWLLGLIKDVFSGLYLGLNAFTFLVIFLVIKSVSDRLYAESGFLFVVTVSVASMACLSIDLLLLLMLTKTHGIAYSMLSDMVPHLLVNAFCASLAPLLPGFARIEGKV